MRTELESVLAEVERAADKLERAGRLLTSDAVAEGRLFVQAVRGCPRVWERLEDNQEATRDAQTVHGKLQGLLAEVQAYRSSQRVGMRA